MNRDVVYICGNNYDVFDFHFGRSTFISVSCDDDVSIFWLDNKEDIDRFFDHFVNKKEERKLKLIKIDENR